MNEPSPNSTVLNQNTNHNENDKKKKKDKDLNIDTKTDQNKFEEKLDNLIDDAKASMESRNLYPESPSSDGTTTPTRKNSLNLKSTKGLGLGEYRIIFFYILCFMFFTSIFCFCFVLILSFEFWIIFLLILFYFVFFLLFFYCLLYSFIYFSIMLSFDPRLFITYSSLTS